MAEEILEQDVDTSVEETNSTQEDYDAEYEKAFMGETTEEPEVEDTAEPDEEAVEETETSEDVETSSEEPETLQLKIDGEIIDASKEQVIAMAQKRLHFEREMQKMRGWKNHIGVIEENKLSADDLALLAKVKSGDKDSISYLLNQSNIDPLDLGEVAQGYQVPKAKQISDSSEYLKNIKGEEAEAFNKYVSEDLPDDFIELMSKDVNVLRGFHEEIQLGRVKQVLPRVKFMMANNPSVRFLEAYQEVLKAMESKPAETRPKVDAKKATIPKRQTTPVTKKSEADDIWSMSDEEFERKMSKIKGF